MRWGVSRRPLKRRLMRRGVDAWAAKMRPGAVPADPPPPLSMEFQLLARDSSTRARLGKIVTDHGEIHTPVFMPVGTAGTVKAITQDQLEELGAEVVLGNTYHLYLRPGHELI